MPMGLRDKLKGKIKDKLKKFVFDPESNEPQYIPEWDTDIEEREKKRRKKKQQEEFKTLGEERRKKGIGRWADIGD